MLRVAALGNYLLDHWKTPNQPDRDLITQTLLLHDMGNILKFNLSKTMLDNNDNNNVNYWINVQKKYIKKYGSDEHIATSKIAQELTGSKRVNYLISTLLGFKQNIKVANSNDWESKICTYSDQRIAPDGVVTLKKRIEEQLERYKNNPNASINAPNRDELVKSGFEIEQQLQTKVTINLQQITDQDIEPYIEKLNNYSFTH